MMYRRFFAIFIFACIISVSLLLFVSCGGDSDDDPEGINLVIILANRANTYSLSETDLDWIEENMMRSFFFGENFGASANLWFIISSGNPQQVTHGRRLNINSTNSIHDRRAQVNSTIRGIRGELSDRTPAFRSGSNGGANLLGALRMAADILRNAPNREGASNANYILIFDSGITTSYPLAMQDFNMIEEEKPISNIISYLLINRLVPDMSDLNVSVDFRGIGGTAANPQRIPNDDIFRNWLTGLWREILGISGANLTNMAWGFPSGSINRVGAAFATVDPVPFWETPPRRGPQPPPSPPNPPDLPPPPTSSITIEKMDTAGNFLADAEFEVHGLNGERVARVITNDEGIAHIPDLVPGTYIIKEIRAPQGFILAESNSRTVEITAGQEIRLRFLNHRPPPPPSPPPISAELFFNDSAWTFRNLPAARRMLSEYYNFLHSFLANYEGNVYIVGSEARVGNPNEDITNSGNVSYNRARVVRKELIEHFNLPEERLILVHGFLTEFSWRNANEYEWINGRWQHNIENARKNMVVAIVPYGSEKYQELRNSGLLD